MPRLQSEPELMIGDRRLGMKHPTYFIADIAANHDGSLDRAVNLIHLAARAGADAAKFQHFTAETIVSDAGFRALGGGKSHQSSWKKSVFDVYKDASVDVGWTPALVGACREAGIAFFTSPYSVQLVDAVDPYVPAFKIGSGDITDLDFIRYVASKGKPWMLATGASSADDVVAAVEVGVIINPLMVLMQCNTNYTASLENFRFIQLNVLRSYAAMFPDMVLGLSDHTPGHATVLGAVALGARVVEKHFTDDVARVGPDHRFSMDPSTWREMVDRTRELEAALGDGIKRVEGNERETVVLQRRCLRLRSDQPAGAVLTPDMVVALRPAPADAVPPSARKDVMGCRLRTARRAGEALLWTDLDSAS